MGQRGHLSSAAAGRGERPHPGRRPLTLAEQHDLHALQPPVPADAVRDGEVSRVVEGRRPRGSVGPGGAAGSPRPSILAWTPTSAPPASEPPPPPPGRGHGGSRNTGPGARSGSSRPGRCGPGSRSRPRARSPRGSACPALRASGRSAGRWSGCTGRSVTWGRSPRPCLQREGPREGPGGLPGSDPPAVPEPRLHPGGADACSAKASVPGTPGQHRRCCTRLPSGRTGCGHSARTLRADPPPAPLRPSPGPARADPGAPKQTPGRPSRPRGARGGRTLPLTQARPRPAEPGAPARAALTAHELPPAPQREALGGAGARVGGQGGAQAVLAVLAVARVVLAPLGSGAGGEPERLAATCPPRPT